MKIRFVFHKPLGERGIGKAIVAWTWILGLFYNWRVLRYNYSHVEIWIPNEGGWFTDYKVIDRERLHRGKDDFWGWGKTIESYGGACFSSTTRGKWEGVRLAFASTVLGHPERWNYIECEVDPERLEVAIAETNKLMGRKYDYLGIFGFFVPFNIQSRKRWYCSEICSWFGYLCRITTKRNKRISPRRLAYILSKDYGEPNSLI